jgi:hypothetical protein
MRKQDKLSQLKFPLVIRLRGTNGSRTRTVVRPVSKESARAELQARNPNRVRGSVGAFIRPVTATPKSGRASERR